MTIHIKVFGRLAELAGQHTIVMEAVTDSAALREALYKNYPALKDMHFFIALNNKIIKENTVIAGGAELALLPPFSGG